MVCHTETTGYGFFTHDFIYYCPKLHESLRSPRQIADFIFNLMTYPLIKPSKAVCRWLTSCCRIAMAKAFRVPTKTANVLALVNPV